MCSLTPTAATGQASKQDAEERTSEGLAQDSSLLPRASLDSHRLYCASTVEANRPRLAGLKLAQPAAEDAHDRDAGGGGEESTKGPEKRVL